MRFIYNDGGRAAAGYSGYTGDCVVRAVAIATCKPYQEVYDALSEGVRSQRLGKRKTRKSSARNGVTVQRKWFKDYMSALGWTWIPTMHIGSGCRVHLHDGELPMGRLIVSVSRHCTTVIDGVVHDTHAIHSEMRMSESQTEGQELRPGQTPRKNGEWKWGILGSKTLRLRILDFCLQRSEKLYRIRLNLNSFSPCKTAS